MPVVRVGDEENGIRALLLRNRVAELDEWRIPGMDDELEVALRAGEPVWVSTGTLWHAFRHGGLPHEQFRRAEFGGKLAGKTWRVSSDGAVTEWTAASRG
ncbi:hypothetical protein [Mycolicibacterium sp. P1-18]|uniref:hypothetical protein n=1 Tax=Mycolicibacterium sp. P1-18 TaxID=2024615 RepID=UPI0011F3289F|nr:hypothetical protein [Mycolicibacterium sp. P1-18]